MEKCEICQRSFKNRRGLNIHKSKTSCGKASHYMQGKQMPILRIDDFKAFPNFSTGVLHKAQEPEQCGFRALMPPISTTTAFKQFAPAENAGFEYSRSGNLARNCLEKCLAGVEGGKHGLCFSSGLAAITTVTQMLRSGDHILCMDDVYGGTNRFFNKCAAKFRLDISMVDMTDIRNIINGIKPNTKMVWIETPTNPTLKLVDIKAVCEVVREETQGWSVKPITVVDNTFMSSYFQRPLSLGADVVMHSISKYMNGHSDVIMGALICNDDDINEQLRFLQHALGTVPSAFDCYLVNQSLKTLPVRMKEHMKNGLLIAKHLDKHPCVEKVIHPGLPSHPHYDIGKRQMIGYSGMCAFYIKGGLRESSAFLKALKIFTLGVSLGGYESLVALPSLQTHASVPEEQRKALGITDSLVRISVGLEDPEDLIADLDQALQVACNL